MSHTKAKVSVFAGLATANYSPKEKPRRSGANSAQPSHLAVEFAERVMDTLGDRDPAEQRQ